MTGLYVQRSRKASWSARLLVAAALLVTAFALVPFGQGAAGDTQKMYITLEVNLTFTVKLPDGTPVGTLSAPGTTITPGTYELIFDNSRNVKNLDFQITGPNVSLQEDMGGGEESSAGDYVTFLPSSQYSYHDGNNQTSPTFYLQTAANGGTIGGTGAGIPGANTSTATVSNSNNSVVGSKGSSTTSTAPAILRGTLNGTISVAGALSLTLKGKSVTTLKSGRYTFAVTDHSSKSGFIVQENRANPTTVTGAPFVGKRQVKITLKAGQWFCYSTFVGKKTFFLVTA